MLCSRGVRYVLKHESAPEIRFVAIQSEEGRRIAQAHGVDPDNPHTFIYLDNGVAHIRSDGVFAMTRRVDGPARLLLPLKLLPRGFRDFFYDRIARNRYRLFGKMDRCYAPPPDIRARFTLPQ